MRKNKSTGIFLLLHFFAYICYVFHADTSRHEVRVVWGICLYKERRLLDVLSLAL